MRPLRLFLLSLSFCALPVAAAHAAPAPTNFKPFAADSVWNLPLRSDAPISGASGAQVAWLNRSVAAKGLWINSTSCGMPLYWADAATPKVKVELAASAYQDAALKQAWSAVPIPSEATPANCSDRNFSVAQVQPDGRIKEWEFWAATKRSNGSWVAQWGGAMEDLRTDRGIASTQSWGDTTAEFWTGRVSTQFWNVTGSSVSQNAGVVTQAELQRGVIDHAVAMALNETAKGYWVWPAQRTDGGSADAAAVPEGARLRLPADLDLTQYRMPPFTRMVAEAAQKYGIVVRDRTHDANVVYTEPPAPGTSDPVLGMLDGKSPRDAMGTFPWSKLQVLDAPRCTGSACTVTPAARIDVDATPVAGRSVILDTTGSTLNQPRSAVAWDLDGNGSYETPGGTAVKRAFVPPAAGSMRVGVRITTREGVVTTAQRALQVVAARTASARAAVPAR